MALQWTQNQQFTAPAAAAGVTVTPSGSAWGSGSAWVQLIAATDAAAVLTSVIPIPGTTGEFEIDIGVGSSGSETVIGTLPGHFHSSTAIRSATQMPWTYPVDLIPNGARVATRLRIDSTSTATWSIAITYYKKPLTGTLETTTQVSKCQPSAAAALSLPTNTSAWTFGTYAELWSAAPANLLIVGYDVPFSFNGQDYEIQIATGGAGSETPIGLIRGVNATADGPHYVHLLNPIEGITSGVRVAARWRKAGTSSFTGNLKVAYVELPL